MNAGGVITRNRTTLREGRETMSYSLDLPVFVLGRCHGLELEGSVYVHYTSETAGHRLGPGRLSPPAHFAARGDKAGLHVRRLSIIRHCHIPEQDVQHSACDFDVGSRLIGPQPQLDLLRDCPDAFTPRAAYPAAISSAQPSTKRDKVMTLAWAMTRPAASAHRSRANALSALSCKPLSVIRTSFRFARHACPRAADPQHGNVRANLIWMKLLFRRRRYARNGTTVRPTTAD